MESASKPVRCILPLLKAPVTDIGPGFLKLAIGAQYGSPTTMQVLCNTAMMDLRKGDLLTLYTEVLLKPTEGNA